MQYVSHYQSPIGDITLAADDIGLIGLWFDGQKHFASTLLSEEHEERPLPIFDDSRRWLDIYFHGKEPDFTPALHPIGTDFRLAVWKQLLEISYGQTATYGQIARNIALEMNRPTMSAQAVGGAVGSNPISLIIPCHRVIGSDGSLTGYAGGTDKKQWLLEMELPAENIFHRTEKTF